MTLMPELSKVLHHVRRPFRRRTDPGTKPGTIVTDPEAPPPVIRVMTYGPSDLHEQEIASPDDLPALLEQRPVAWVNVVGLGDADTIHKLGEQFQLHELALEDVVHVHQRPKVEEYDEHLFIVARVVSLEQHLWTGQMTFFLGKDYLLTFQEGGTADYLEPVRQRLRKGTGRIRNAGPDYLAYALIDAVLDQYFPVVEKYGARIDQLDEELSAGNSHVMAQIHQLRNALHVLRKTAWSHREAVGNLQRHTGGIISDDTRVFLRDCYDHTVQILDVLETYREMCAELRDFYFTLISNRTNDVMKILTMIATLFIPLSFIAGVYGMNFDPNSSPWNMPELRWFYGYPFALVLMAVSAGGLIFYIWRRGWFRS